MQALGLQDNGGHLVAFVLPIAFLSVVLTIAFWANDPMRLTLVNRRFLGAVVITFVAQAALSLAGWVLDMVPAHVQVLQFSLWFVIAAMASITIDRRLWPTASAYAVGFVGALALPHERNYLLAVANLVLTVNALIIWHPGRRQPVAPEPRLEPVRGRGGSTL
jgi:hypothetical protein